jgi:leucyl aminopeptidase
VKIAVQAGRKRGADDGPIVRFVTTPDRRGIPDSVSPAEFSGTPNSLLHLHTERLLFAGLGPEEGVKPCIMRRAAGTAVMFLRKIGRATATFELGNYAKFTGPVIEGALLANYRFEKFKKPGTRPLTSLGCIVPEKALAAARRDASRAEAIASAANEARDLANLPGNFMYPATLAEHARKIAVRLGMHCAIMDQRALVKGRFGGILAVGAGSARPPRLIVLEHRRGPRGERPIALVGKAVTFDSGGISIKPAASMEEMIFDKCGGIAVLGAMSAIAALGLKRNVIGVIAAAENLPSSTAFRPGDVVTTHDGTSVEVINTDAEGRIVLADAISHARKACDAQAIIDLATLTGACGVALGEYAAGLWTNGDPLRDALLSSAERTGERLWPMPLFPEYTEQIRSEVAALKNTGGRRGGACTGAAFLQVFAGKTPWAHLDIAATASRERDACDLARGATGFGVRLLVDLVENWGRPAQA